MQNTLRMPEDRYSTLSGNPPVTVPCIWEALREGELLGFSTMNFLTQKDLKKLISETTKGYFNTFGKSQLMIPFNGDISELNCPYSWYFLKKFISGKIRIVVILQDWDSVPLGSEPSSLKVAINELSGNDGDKTLKNLKASGFWKGFCNHEVFITNAVWGLRPPNLSKSGYLGDKIHKPAYPMWREIICRIDPELVFVCGAWSRWEDMQPFNKMKLSDYLARWDRYVKRNDLRPCENLKDSTLICLPHPSVWQPNFNYGELKDLISLG